MANFNFTTEQLESAKAAKSPEELVAKAKEQGIDITLEQAAAFLKPDAVKTEEISDEELDNVAGGGCGVPSKEQQSAWRVEATLDGRPLKVALDYVRDACPECGTIASIYAVRAEDTEQTSYHNGVARIYHRVAYKDCKCYAASCQKTFDMLLK